MTRRGITRRGFLASTVAAGGVVGGGLLATRYFQSPPNPRIVPGQPLALSPNGKLLDTDFTDPFAGGQYLGYLRFEKESDPHLPEPQNRTGKGHNARRVIDVASLLTPEGRETPNDQFYIRTEYPDELKAPPEWKIKLHGQVKQSKEVLLKDLLPSVENKGPRLLECSENSREQRFGLLSVANWAGVSLERVIKLAQPTSKAKAVLINGFDGDSHLPYHKPPYQTHSWPTCSWIFTIDQLLGAGAFLATEMNGKPLPKDQGAPVRLVVPGWYGCTESKWVNEIKFVDDKQPATLQMLEFASRTFQPLHLDDANPAPPGMGPDLARDYQPAMIEQAALPVRVEAWRLDGEPAFRVVGITWGGPQRTDKLLIRFVQHNSPRYEPVQFCQAKTSNPAYGIWCHHWRPKRAGGYWIEMRLADRTVQARKMRQRSQIGPDSFVTWHARHVQIPAV